MKKILVPGLILCGLSSGLGLFLSSGLSSLLLIPWLTVYIFLIFVAAYFSLFTREQSHGFIFLILGIIGLNFLVQVTGGPASPLKSVYFLLAAAATFQPRLKAYMVPLIIVSIEGANLLAAGQSAPDQWYSLGGFGLSLAGVIVIITPFTGRIIKQSRMARERYQKLLSDANALDPLAEGANLEALTEKSRQTANVSLAVEREGAFKGLIDMISGIVPAHTYALFIDDRDEGVFTLRGIRSRSMHAVSAKVQIAKGSGLIGISADKNQPQYLPHMVIPVKSLGYYTLDVPVRSFLALPLSQGDRVYGVLAVDSLESEDFPTDTQEMLTRFAPFFSQIIEKIRISVEMDIRAKNFAALHDMSEALNSSLELSDILDKLTKQIQNVAPSDFCAVILYDDKSSEAIIAALRGYEQQFIGDRFPVAQSAILSHLHKQWRDRGAINIFHAPDLGARGREIGLFPYKELQKPLQSLYGRPLVARDKFIGAFFMGSIKPRAFTEYHRNFIDTLMNQVSMVIDNTMLHQSILDLARTDGLTGLLNHRTFMEKLNEKYRELDRTRRPFSVLLIDIDKFKNVNDKYGHPVGDIAIKAVARVLKETIRGTDFAARYGGEEFAVGMVETNVNGAVQIAERVRTIMEKTVVTRVHDGELKVELSIGVSTFPDDTDNAANLVTMSDEALYHAKRTGRNRVCLHKQVRDSKLAATKSK